MKRTGHRRRRFAGWMIPLAYALGSLFVGMTIPRLEHRFLEEWVSTMSAGSAVAFCSAIASGMISLTGIVFSLTFVMVQFSATAYSPRLVLWLARDPVMSHALGVFSATFLYALALIAWVDREASGRVPWLSGMLVLGLLLASVGMFVALIQRIEMLQVNRMLVFTGDQGRRAIDDLYDSGPLPPEGVAMPDPDGPPSRTVVHLGRPRAVQAVHADAIVEMATEAGVEIQLAASIGDTVFEQSPLMRVYGTGGPLDEAALRRCLELGDERTFEQDPKYAVRLVVDIAIKALSPAINDPTTAVQALDQIEDLLMRLGRHRLERGLWFDATGRVRLRASFPNWDDFLLLALDEIRSYGSDSVQVMRRMTALIDNLLAVLPAHRHASLRHWRERLRGSIARSFEDAEEKRDASVADRQGLGLGTDRSGEAIPEVSLAGNFPPRAPSSPGSPRA